MKKKQEYRIYSAGEAERLFKRRPKGRSNSVNNDDELTAIALQGLAQGTYETYTDAAEKLHAMSWEYGKDYKKRYAQPHTKERLKRAIGSAFFKRHGQTIHAWRKAQKT